MGNLVLGRRVGESILIGDDITITLVSLKEGMAQIAVNAPQDRHILRGELKKSKHAQQQRTAKAVAQTPVFTYRKKRRHKVQSD